MEKYKRRPAHALILPATTIILIIIICCCVLTSHCNDTGLDETQDEGTNINKIAKLDAAEASLLFNVKSEEDESPNQIIDAKKTLIWGPGLVPHEIVLPARYFFIHFVDTSGAKLNSSASLEDELHVRIDCNGERQIWSQILNRKDGSFIVRYKVFQSCASGFRIIITYGSAGHLGRSPYIIKSSVHPDNCNCPKFDVPTWQKKGGCNYAKLPEQIHSDLRPFPPKSIDFEDVLHAVKEKFGSHPHSYSFCHYAIIDNQIYRKCYGQHIGFHIFPDSILLSLTRKMYFPDMEFIMNMGDWPLSPSNPKPPGESLLPILSWCKSNETADIVLPTYEITEASLEGMGRVSLDMMTVQSNTERSWDEKIPKLFWRGRDSRQERLDLIQLGRRFPELFNVSLTNFFFFRDKEHIYGPKTDHISFFKFFDYKYQLSIDGTVAAYRFPYLLAGDSVILKTDSPYFEHFYSELRPWTHYIPVAADLSDLVEKIKWAIDNDEKAHRVGQNGRAYAQQHLMPLNIFCYHATVYNEFAKRLKNPVIIRPDMELVKQPINPDPRQTPTCGCKPVPIEPEEKDEL